MSTQQLIRVGDIVLVPCRVLEVGRELPVGRGERILLVSPTPKEVRAQPAFSFFKNAADVVVPVAPEANGKKT